MKTLEQLDREGAWDGTGTRLDSGLYFAGTDVLGATAGFVPMLHYDPQECRPKLDDGTFRRDEVASKTPALLSSHQLAARRIEGCVEFQLWVRLQASPL